MPTSKPIIGITLESTHQPEDDRSMGSMKLNWNYAQAISDAGGVPMIVPPMADVVVMARIMDGWLIPGGLDIDARRFGEENHTRVELQDPARYECESKLYAAVDKMMPILGICYGCQFLNVVRGGNLIQHLPDVLGGDESHSGGTLDFAHVECASKLHKIVQTESVRGKSFHHQAVNKVGSGLAVAARHEDGTIEAVEALDHPWMVGVQWHPERTFDDAPTIRLFAAFVQAAKEFKASKSNREQE